MDGSIHESHYITSERHVQPTPPASQRGRPQPYRYPQELAAMLPHQPEHQLCPASEYLAQPYNRL
jgi:hypothetical protein